MTKPLIIVESGTKTKTISKLLDNRYNVICSYGHFNNLPPNKLGIDTNTWHGDYVITNKKAIDNIRKFVRGCDIVYIASDPDMEGEAIAYHIHCHIKDLLKNKKYYRIEFNEITKHAIETALENPRTINENVVDAQETRRFVDRLVGYKLSPVLWNEFQNNTLSVGRVQSIALKMCYDRYDKMINHDVQHHWVIRGKFSCKNKNIFDFTLHKGDTIVKEGWDKIIRIMTLFDFKTKFSLDFVENKGLQHPPPPFTTTSLQQDAYQKFHFTSKKTMSVAQQLYENGFITYMRTDSTHISNSFKNDIIKYIEKEYQGCSQFRSPKNKIVNAQEAHEAIRVTNINMISCDINSDCNKLYQSIWKRTIASQMVAAEFIDLKTTLSYTKHDYTFVQNKSLLCKKGFLIIYGKEIDDYNRYTRDISNIVPLQYGCEATIGSSPVLLNEISLIKELEKNGIGRPSTYATIVEKIVDKKYVEKSSYDGKSIKLKNRIITVDGFQDKEVIVSTSIRQKDLLIPTEIGKLIIEYMKQSIPFLLDVKFTSNMEATLDKITEKQFSKKIVLEDFYVNHIQPLCTNNNQNTNSNKKRETGIINTKYGYCYYHSDTNKYTNIESFLKWKKKTVKTLTSDEVQFLHSIPKLLDDGTELHIGPYGLYLKKDDKNVKIEKNKWCEYI